MIACFDVDYRDEKAQAACVLIDQWGAAKEVVAYTQIIQPIEDYVSGQFYRRELPCILAVYELMP